MWLTNSGLGDVVLARLVLTHLALPHLVLAHLDCRIWLDACGLPRLALRICRGAVALAHVFGASGVARVS